MSTSNLLSNKNNNQSDNRQERYSTPLDVQERTLRVSNYGRKVTKSILKELFSQVYLVNFKMFKSNN